MLINTHWLSNKVEEAVQAFLAVENYDLVYESELLGTAGTLRANFDRFKSDIIIIAHADYTDLNLNDLINFHRSHEYLVTISTFITDKPEECGVINLDSGHVVQGFEKVKNPPSNLANAAIYIFDRDYLRKLVEDEKITDISTEILPKLIGEMKAYQHEGFNIDIGSIDSLKNTTTKITHKKSLGCNWKTGVFLFLKI